MKQATRVVAAVLILGAGASAQQSGTVEALPCLPPGGWCLGVSQHPWYQNGPPNIGNGLFILDNSFIWTGCSWPSQYSLMVVSLPSDPWAPPPEIEQDCCRIRLAWPPYLVTTAERVFFPIPYEPSLRGVEVHAQGFCVDVDYPNRIHPHGAIRIRIGPI